MSPELAAGASVLNFHPGRDDDLGVSVSFQRKYAIGVAAFGAALIAVLATQAVPFPTVWHAILVIFVLACVGGGVFCLALAVAIGRTRLVAISGSLQVLGFSSW
jgi:hypothetical protein